MRKVILTSLISTLLAGSALAQNKDIITSRDYPQTYFKKPLNILPDASGTFGELRSTHFHAGDDYRTQQKIGLPLHAAAQGYVSRVRVQIGGGGNSVYIAHPNGFTTVYLHMDEFSEELTKIVRAEQYKLKRFDVDIELKENQHPINQGQYFGRAGNTGGSGGPHLHFEIRDTKSQHPLNPQLFGLHFKDAFAPTINGITLYDLNQNRFDEHTGRRNQQLKALGSGRYELTAQEPIAVNGKFGIGINTIDRHRAGGFQNGVYSIELYLDGEAISTVLFEELDFSNSGAIHSYIDYSQFKKAKVKIQKSFKDPGNPIKIFKHLTNNGIIELTDNEVHQIKYVVKDVHGNCSELNFKVKNSAGYTPKSISNKGEQFPYNQENSFTKSDIKLLIPKGALYTDLDFTYGQEKGSPASYSNIHHVHNGLTPLLTIYKLSIKPTNLPKGLESKAIIASKEAGSVGGKFENGWVNVNTKIMGSFYVTVDTVAPTITPRNLTAGKNLSNQSKIDFTIRDDFSGIQSFNGYIDDQWVLMEYDSKNRHLWHKFDAKLAKGKHQFKLVVKDWKDNEKIYQVSFTK